MKIPEKSKEKKDKVKKKLGHNKKPKPKKEQVLIVAQEIKFARLLSGNEKKSRDKVLKTLKKWLLNCFEKGYEFKEDDFLRVWKGLFYAVWMSDKPLIQEELCESIAEVLDVFPAKQIKYAILMFKAGLKILATEWYGIDQHRMDKFLMLVRRYLRGSLRCLARCDWSLKTCQMYSKMLDSSDGILCLQTPHYARNALSMILHFLDCYLEEIAKVSNGTIPDTSLVELLRPICGCLRGEGARAVGGRRVLLALLRQSEQGLQYREATQAWKQMGCPEGGPEALELVEDDDSDSDNDNSQNDMDIDDSTNKPLDPRAGRVNVELTPLPVPAALIAEVLREILTKATSKAHRRIRICLQRFEQLSKSVYPLPVEAPPLVESVPLKSVSRHSARTLHALEKNLVSASDELALRGLSRKHRKRLLAKARTGVSIVDDVERAKTATNGDWQVESTEPSKREKDDTNKENKKRKRDDTNKKNIKKKKISKDKDEVTKDNSKTDKNIIVSKNDSNINKNKIKQNGTVKEKIKNDQVAKVIKDKQKPKENGIKILKISKDKIQKPPEKILNGKDKKVPAKKNTENILKQTKDNKIAKNPTLVVNKVKSFQKQTKKIDKAERKQLDTPKRVKFVLKNNSMQRTIDYYKSVRLSPNIPYDGTKRPIKTNLKPSTPSPINPFFKKKMKLSFG